MKKIIVFILLCCNFLSNGQQFLKEQFGSIKVCVVYPAYAEAQVNETFIKVVRRGESPDLVYFPEEVFFSFDNPWVWYNSHYVNVSALDRSKDHVITVYWDYITSNSQKCLWGNYLFNVCKFYQNESYVGDIIDQRVAQSGTPMSKINWRDLMMKYLAKESCTITENIEHELPNDFIKTKVITLNRTNSGIAERITIEANLGITAFFSKVDNNRLITTTTSYGYKDLVRLGQQGEEMSQLQQKSLEATASGSKNARSIDELQSTQNAKIKKQQADIDYQRNRRTEIDNKIEKNQKEAAAAAAGVVGIAALGIMSNNENNIYDEKSSSFGLGIGFLSETFPYIVNNQTTTYNNQVLLDDKKSDLIEQAGTLGLVADMKYSPFVSEGYRPRFILSGGYSMAIAELIKPTADNSLPIGDDGYDFNSYYQTSNHITFYSLKFANYIGNGKTKFIVNGEYEAKHVDYNRVSSILATKGSDSYKSYDTSWMNGNLQNYKYGIGFSTGSPNKLNFEMILERCDYATIQTNSNYKPLANYRLSLNFWKASLFTAAFTIASFNQFQNNSSIAADLSDSYRKKYIYQIYLIYNKDWFWRKRN